MRAPFDSLNRAFISYCRLEKGNGERWIKFQEGTLAKFSAWARDQGARGWEGLEPYHLSEFLSACEALGDTRNTVHARAAIIRACARWAEAQGRVDVCRLARAPLPKVVWLEREIPPYAIALQLALQERNIHLRDFYLLALMTGLRRGELLALEWTRVDLALGIAEVKATTAWKPKSRKARAVPLERAALDILTRRKKTHPVGPFLKAAGPVLKEWDISKGWKKIVKAAGHPELRFHDTRHEFVTRIVRDLAMDITTAQEVAGHANITTTRRYAHARKDAALVAKAALDKAARGKATA